MSILTQHAPGVRLPDLPLWTTRFPREVLLDKAQNEAMFEQGFRMKIIKPGDLLFPSFATCFQSGVNISEIVRRGYPTYIGVDLSSEKRPGNAIVAVAIEPTTGARFLVEVAHGAWSSPELAEKLADVSSRHSVQFIMVENNAYQQSIIDWIRKLKTNFPYWMKIEPFNTGKNKLDPQYGLAGFEVEFKNKGWVIPSAEFGNHSSGCKCSWCLIAREFLYYPKHATTDTVMACWMAKTAIDRWGRRPGSTTRVGSTTTR